MSNTEILLTGEDVRYNEDFYVQVDEDGSLILSGGEYGSRLDDESRSLLAAMCLEAERLSIQRVLALQEANATAQEERELRGE